MKRSASPLLGGLPSPFNSGVTLFDPSEAASPLRRSKRQKVEVKYEETDDEESTALVTQKKKPTKAKMRAATASPSNSAAGATASGSSTPLKAKRVASPRKPKLIPQALETPHPAPARWRETYDTITEMRARIVAPVDTMGCGRAQLEETVPQNQRFATLVSLMLSSQTKDEVTSAAVSKLREALGGSISVDAVIAADENIVSEAICKVGFWRRKTQYIKQAAQRLKDDFDSDVPKTVDELCSLPGVGPKMAFLALHVAWKVNAGIGVDVHVHRITNRLGWHQVATKTPEETRLNLQSWLPTELRPTFTGLLVGFGQTVCLPIGPRCDNCELSDGLCPSAQKVNPRKGKKMVEATSLAGPNLEIELDIDEEKPMVTSDGRTTSPLELLGGALTIKPESE
ncbi:DNA glycosylase [Amylocystis lapponica]|nr:DNA glycosylase [Amylocystis lapponica]